MYPARILIIAGSDSGGGAGIQADIKAVSALGGFALTALTALTAQNTIGVQGVHPVPLDFVKAQFQSVHDDIGLDAVKTGMLHSSELVSLVAGLLAEVQTPVVVDPVMVAKGGDRLLTEDAVAAVREHLIPQASLLTPNLDEAEALTGLTVRDGKTMAQAAKELVALGAKAVLVKGGHLEDAPCDLLFDGRDIHSFKAPRLNTPHTHGTGCTLASACATLLGQGWELVPAVKRARLLVRRAINGGLALGKGHGPVNALADLAPRLALGECLDRVQAVLDRLEEMEGLGDLVPEVRSQLGFALPGAAGPEEVVAVSGRITNVGRRIKASGPPRAGASRHVAKIILAAMAADPEMRAAMALRFNEPLLDKARSLGWRVAEFSRADEPQEVKEREGSTLEWGTTEAIRRMGRVPDMVFDRGEVGKEPVIRLIARHPEELLEKILALVAEERS